MRYKFKTQWQADIVYIDGTFEHCPKFFTQLRHVYYLYKWRKLYVLLLSKITISSIRTTYYLNLRPLRTFLTQEI